MCHQGTLFYADIPYADYRELNEFYTIPNIVIFRYVKTGIELRRNLIDDYLVMKYDVLKLYDTFNHKNRTNDGKKAILSHE